MTAADLTPPYVATHQLPSHLQSWKLPPDWRWGAEGAFGPYRHYQEVIDALDRSLSLVSTPNPEHVPWLVAEAKQLAHRGHPLVPTTYHFWAPVQNSTRGPGYLRRWIAGETIASRVRRLGAEDIPSMLKILRMTGSAIAYLHSSGTTHGAIASETIWVTPNSHLWMLGWEWAINRPDVPAGLMPDHRYIPWAPEWKAGEWTPTPETDQWQLGALAFFALTGEYPPNECPPMSLVRPDLPHAIAEVLDRALARDPARRFHSVSALLRDADRAAGGRTSIFTTGGTNITRGVNDSEEDRLRWATGDEYEVLARLGSGTYGSVWRVRDLALEREVALKMLHPHVAADLAAMRRFRREAQLAARLAHPAIVPIYDWDWSGDVAWYTMELAEGGSLANLVERNGPRSLSEIAPQIEHVLDGLRAAHSVGIIHRDLKPENILIDRYRRWRIADFGVARIPGEEQQGTTGTPEFSAPEQLLGEPQGPTVDIFAVAAIVAYVLTGTPPFGTGDAQAILARQLSGRIDLESFPPDIAEWLRKGLDAMPENRTEDAREMQKAWREAVEETLEREGRRHWWRRWLHPESGESEAAEGI
ncbi:MAG TPA: serine/threonine-protein kinase [Gemmatimonadaceae bacterium]|nr:serine/threonine-protein kinase [Gemmatimonadaceae bacterium]